MIDHSELLVEGQIIGGFKIDKAIGHGNMGIIYRAIQVNLNRPIALKILFKSIAEDQDFVRCFFREAQAAAAFTHQNIVQAFDVGQTEDGIYFFAMELIQGGDISQQLDRLGTYPPLEALKYIVSIADGLDYGSSLRKLTHGDIKPANIMMTKTGIPKLADLGLARMGGEIQGESDGIMLTPLYAAPEMINGTWVVGDPRADMYSVGATLYHMISGKPPFNDKDYKEVIRMQVNDTHIPLTEIENPAPAGISKLVDKLLEKNPDDRFEDWAAAKAAIERAIKLPKGSSKKKTKVLHFHETEGHSTLVKGPSKHKKKTKLSSSLIMLALIISGAIAVVLSLPATTTPEEYKAFSKSLAKLGTEETVRKIELFIKNNGTSPEAEEDLKKHKSILDKRSLFTTSSLASQEGIIRDLESRLKENLKVTANQIQRSYKKIEKGLTQNLDTFNLTLHLPFNKNLINHSSFYNPFRYKVINGRNIYKKSPLDKAVNLSGQSILLGDTNRTRFSHTNTFTIAFWINAKDPNFTILGKYKETKKLISKGYKISLKDGHIEIKFNGNATSDNLYALSQEKLQQNSWQHIVVQYQDKTVKLYLNGKQATLDSKFNLQSDFSCTSPFIIGFQDTKADMDDLMIWSRSIRPKEVSELYKLRQKTELEELVNRYQRVKSISLNYKPRPNRLKIDFPKSDVKKILVLLKDNFGNWQKTHDQVKDKIAQMVNAEPDSSYLQALATLSPLAQEDFLNLLSDPANQNLVKDEMITSGPLEGSVCTQANEKQVVFEKKTPIGVIQKVYYWSQNNSHHAALALLQVLLQQDNLSRQSQGTIFIAALLFNKPEAERLAKSISRKWLSTIVKKTIIVRDLE
jgi:serine/threonine protein kinase